MFDSSHLKVCLFACVDGWTIGSCINSCVQTVLTGVATCLGVIGCLKAKRGLEASRKTEEYRSKNSCFDRVATCYIFILRHLEILTQSDLDESTIKNVVDNFLSPKFVNLDFGIESLEKYCGREIALKVQRLVVLIEDIIHWKYYAGKELTTQEVKEKAEETLRMWEAILKLFANNLDVDVRDLKKRFLSMRN